MAALGGCEMPNTTILMATTMPTATRTFTMWIPTMCILTTATATITQLSTCANLSRRVSAIFVNFAIAMRF